MKPLNFASSAKWVLILSFSSVSHNALALSLQEYLNEVKNKNQIFKSYEAAIEAAESRRVSGDISLVPQLTLKGSSLSDQTQPSQLGTKKDINEYTLVVSKLFSTGTAASVNAKASDYTIQGVSAPYDRFATSSLGVSLSQSLWKNSFGAGIGLRQDRETSAAQTEKQALELQRRQTLIDAENAYWDYLSAQEDLKNKKANLERAKKLEGWVSRRASNGIADEADVLNSKALVASREFLVSTAQDALISAERSVKESLGMGVADPTPPLTGDLRVKRGLSIDANTAQRVVRLDAYITHLEAKTKALVSQEVSEGYKPDLVLEGAYNTNVFDKKLSEATSNISKNDKPTTMVSLKLVYLFDTDVKQAAVNAASKDALAAKLKSERRWIESDNSYSEFKRKFAVLSEQIRSAEKIAEIQLKRARAEQDRFSKGRSITSTVVTAEQEAAEAELNLVKLQIAQRKLEAQAQLFVALEEKEL